jgi:hypothetical protein
MPDRTPVNVAGLVLYRDRQHLLHADKPLPETFTVSGNTIATLRLKADPQAYLAGDRLVLRCVEGSAVYRLTAPDDTGTHAAVRCA